MSSVEKDEKKRGLSMESLETSIFKGCAVKDGPSCGQTKVAVNQKTNEEESTWFMIPYLEKLCKSYNLAIDC